MIKVIGNIPKTKFGVACSGGVDSMAVLDFLIQGNYNPEVIYFNHNTDHGRDAERFVTNYCNENNLTLHIGRTDLKPKSNKEKVQRAILKERAILENLDGILRDGLKDSI